MALPGDINDPFGIPPVDPWADLGMLLEQQAAPMPVGLDPALPPAGLPMPGEQSIGAPPAALVTAPLTQAPPAPMADAAPAVPWSDWTSAPDVGVPTPPEPDAISGVGGVELPAPPDLRAPSLPPEYRTSLEEGVELSGMSQEGLGVLAIQQAELARGASERVLSLGRQRDEEQFAKNQEAFRIANEESQKQLALLEKERTELEQKPVGWAGKSTGQKIAGLFAAMVGGLVQSRTGSARNNGLDMINQIIEQDLADRREHRLELRQRKTDTIGGFQRAVDALRQQESLRQHSWEQVEKQALAEQQNYDPRGTTAILYAQFVHGVRGKRAASLAKFQQDAHKQAIDDAKLELDFRQQRAKELQDRNSNALGWANVATARENAAATRESTAQARQDRLEEKSQARADKFEERLLERGVYGPATVDLDESGKPKIDETGKPVISRAPPLVQRDGKTRFEAGTKEEAAELRKKVDAASEINSIINDVLEIRDRSGGETAAFNSDDYQRLKTLENKLQLLGKQGTQGMSSDKDMEAIRGALGAADITSLRERAAGLEEGRDRTTSALNSALSYSGYNGKEIKFARGNTKPENTPADEAFKSLIKKPATNIDEAEKEALRVIRTRRTGAPDGPWASQEQAVEAVREARREAADYKDITPAQKYGIEDLGVVAQYGKTPAEKAVARANLVTAVTAGGTAAIRDKAKSVLDSLNLSETASREQTGDTTFRSVARDEVQTAPTPRPAAPAAPPRVRTDSAGNPL